MSTDGFVPLLETASATPSASPGSQDTAQSTSTSPARSTYLSLTEPHRTHQPQGLIPENGEPEAIDSGEIGDVVSDDDDNNENDGSAEKPRGPTAKKRRENIAFQDWLEKNQREVSKASKEDLERHDRLSVARLLENSTSKKIIASPREYQIDLFERAKERNTIVVLDTGSGKTLIAALLLRHTLENELQNRSLGQSHKVAFFLVEKVALCFQQHAVLTCNLEFPIGKFYGEMTGISRTKEFWVTQLAASMAFVCTAQILLDLLNCGFIQINQINLLVFDEAHHTKKNHPYARIIKDHYLRELTEANRPRILGMTASPVDAQTKDIRYAATELEGMLWSKIATVSDEALLQSQAHKQQVEIKEYYQRLQNPEESRTELWDMIASRVRDNLQFKIHLDFSKAASSVLGTWCADRYWELLMTDLEAGKLEAKTGRDFASDLATGDEAMAAVRQVRELIRDHDFKSISSKDPLYLSSKVRTLHEVLEDAFCQRKAKRCIVFVQARSTAFLLADLFQQPGMHIPGIKASFMIGSNNGSASATNMSYRDQIVSLQKFRYGETNCLFATSVAEEGIDIPECDVIIRFDLYTSAIQYIQSKGRARQKSSLYISMLEEGNTDHLRRLRQATRDAHALRQFCSALPEDRKVQDFVIDAATIAQHEQVTQKSYTIGETGARLTFITSLEVLAKFVSSLPGNGEQQLEYIVTSIGKKFIARIIFPDTSPVKTVSGEEQRSKQLARCSAAFEACVELIKKKYVDGHLQPVFAKKLPAMRNARLALRSDKKSEYDMRIKPEFWSCLGSPAKLFPTLLALDKPEALGRPSRPLILLTRRPLPNVPAIPLFFGNGQVSGAQLSASQAALELSPERIDALANFTLKVFHDVFSKEYAAKPEEIPYFIAPFDISSDSPASKRAAQIDWNMIDYVQANGELSWKNAPDEGFFQDKLAVDPWDGSRKFILNGINKSLKPSDPTPKGVPQPKSLAYRKVEQNIKEYSNSLLIQGRRRIKWREDQPVVIAELLPLRRNFLDEYFVDQEVNGKCYIILEPLRISPIPIDIVGMTFTLPVIMYRIDSVLVALEACSLVGLTIRPGLALEAATKDSFNSEEHGEDQLDFQAGMGKNYERLEFLGDTFLKMATTISVFTLIPSGNEFEYHVERMVMLCNSNMFNHAVNRNLQQYIRTKAFDRRTWYPSMVLKRGKAPKTELTHRLSHKSVADVCEALIGAAYMTTSADGDMDMDMAVKAVTAMVNSDNHRMASFSDYFAAFKPPEWHSRPATAVQRLAVDQVAEITGYRFRCAPLLRSAFKHPSYTFETVPDYQRLEFLGDALLDMAVVDFLFRRFPEADPKWLTEHKTAMVSNQFQGCLCVKLGLHRHMLLATSALLGDVREYVAQLEQAEETARLKVQATGSSSTPKDFWIDAPQPPKALADVVEALAGAMFVDSHYDYAVVQRFFAHFIQPYFEDMALYDSFASNHPVTALAHRLQGDFGCSRWTLHVAAVPAPVSSGVAVLVDSDIVCALMLHERVLCHATAKNGSDAKVAVARMALQAFAETASAGQFREDMACDCGTTTTTATTTDGEPEPESQS